ncbi:MAG: ribokinase [Fusobacteriaceae bacterium]
MKNIIVIGSINMDLVTLCERAPRGGETLFGKEFFQIPGGKGANQAVAMGKLKSQVTMLGKIGNDSLGEELLQSMKKNGVNVNNIEKTSGSSGIAKIIVEKNGENRILVVPGANGKVDIEYVDRHVELLKKADYIVAQLEIPLETVKYVFKKAHELKKITILNPAPAIELDDELIKYSDYIIPNETELEILTGVKITDDDSIKIAAKVLMEKGVKNLIITLGSKGSRVINKELDIFIPAFRVDALDTTAAGDSFIGGFLNGISLGLSLKEAVERGTTVAAISVTRRGAQTSLPTLEEVLEYKGEKR